MGEMLNLDRIHHNGNPEITIGVDKQFKMVLNTNTNVISVVDPATESMFKINEGNISLEKILTSSGTMISRNTVFAEVGEWSDGNVNNENRLGYFVSINTETTYPTIVKANSTSKVRGIVVENPGFATNASQDKFGTDKNLKKKYCYVGISGFLPVIDNGQCTVNGRCVPSNNGTAVPSTNEYGYLVVERVDDTHVKILIDLQEGSLNELKEAIEALDESKVDKVSGKGLSTNDLTNTLKTNYDAAYTHISSEHLNVATSDDQETIIFSYR